MSERAELHPAGADENEVTLITADGERLVPQAPKPVIAAAVIDEVERLLGGR